MDEDLSSRHRLHWDLLTCVCPVCSSGVVSAVVFIAVCVLAVVTRLLYRQQQAQRSSSMKQKEHRHSVDTAYQAELHLHNSVRDNMKEYYIWQQRAVCGPKPHTSLTERTDIGTCCCSIPHNHKSVPRTLQQTEDCPTVQPSRTARSWICLRLRWLTSREGGGHLLSAVNRSCCTSWTCTTYNILLAKSAECFPMSVG